MCRLFGFRASRPSSVHRSLLRERNALMHQSQEHKDGWGIGFYTGEGPPTVKKGAGAAFADADFACIAEVISSDCVVAHVRKASVGPVRVENSHPFAHGRWLFAHNGTVAEFARHKAELESLLPPRLRATLQGDTDSERCAALFMAEIEARGDPHSPDYPFEHAAEALRATVWTIRSRCDKPGTPSQLNFLVSNGRLLVACRAGKELYVSSHKRRSSKRDTCADLRPWCEGPPGPDHFLVASEILSSEDVWTRVPEEWIVGVDGAMRRHASSLAPNASVLTAP